MQKRVLIVDDEQDIRNSLALLFADEGFTAASAENAQSALAQLAKENYGIVLCDIRMPGIDGLELLRRIRDWYPETSVIIMTAYASVETAIQALRNGAYDYIIKPVDFDELMIRVRHIIRHRQILFENTILRSRLKDDDGFSNIIGQSPQMKEVFALIRRIAGTKSNVLITGKSGTGKELVAKAIHFHSDRKENVFLPINCGAISETLIESELFGHKKGAFTDAFEDKLGVFQLANGGTLFLDEIAEIPLHLQVKLLRALDDRLIIPVGGSLQIKVDVRIISATNQDLFEKVQNGTFREDLFYRLNVVDVKLPTLSERTEDIPLLVEHFLKKYGNEMGKPIVAVDNETMRALTNHNWKGGVRELENVIERAVIFCDTTCISIANLPPHFVSNITDQRIPNDFREAMKYYERKHILEVLRRCKFSKEKATQELNIGLSSLYRKLEELEISNNELKTP